MTNELSHNNKSYELKTKPYMELHKAQIEEMRDAVKSKIGCAFRNYFFDCECGTRVGFHTYRFHLATMKHRKVCGDLPDPTALKQSD
jgi:hypothetical protein